MKELYGKYFMKQKMMRTVLIPLCVIALYAIYTFGWRVLALLLLNLIAAVVVEYVCERKIFNKKKISEAVIITSILYTMTLPVSLPFGYQQQGLLLGCFLGRWYLEDLVKMFLILLW